MKWLIQFSRQRSGKGMAEKLAQEIIAASKGEGAARKTEGRHARRGRIQPGIRAFPGINDKQVLPNNNKT